MVCFVYNVFMKRFLALLVIFFIGLNSWAKAPDVLVLPLFMTSAQTANVYGFETVSEIVATELMQNFNRSKKIVSDDWQTVKTVYQNDFEIGQIAQTYKTKGLIDFDRLVNATKKVPADYVLLTIAYVADKNQQILDAWDVMSLSSDFGVGLDYDLTTKIILVDKMDGVVVWQKTYTTPLSSGNKPFLAKNYSQAVEQYQKISSYLKNIVVKDVEHNLMLKFYPKQIDFSKNINRSQATQEGVGLKYYKKMVPLTKITQPSESFEQQLLREDSFSL